MRAAGETGAGAAGTVAVGDFVVHRFGFGAMRITGEGVWGEPPDREGALSVLRRAVELGIDFIDTADSYGPNVSEELVAEALFPYPLGLVIATKAGLTRPGPGRWQPDGRPEHIRQAVEGSLRRLRVECIDLYQFHRPDPAVPYAESVGTFAALQQEGKVRHVGVSNVTLAQLREAQSVTEIVSVQNRYNLTDRTSEDVLQACAADGLAFIPWAPIRDAERVPAAARAAERLGATPVEVAIAWLLAHSRQMLTIVGTASVRHLEENLGAVDLELAPDEVAALDAAAG